MFSTPNIRIGLVSDTHGSLDAFERVLTCFKDHGSVDLILHMGDLCYHGPRNPLPNGYAPMDLAKRIKEFGPEEILFVQGNCDNRVDEQSCGHDMSQIQRTVDTSIGRIIMAHGDLGDEATRIEYAHQEGARFYITGHTHIRQAEVIDGITFINPGSPTLPKDKHPSCAILTDTEVVFYHTETGAELSVLKF